MSHRIAVLLPELKLDDADRAVDAEAALLLWMALCEALAPHAELGVMGPAAMHVARQGGRFVPLRARHDEEQQQALLRAGRRDELLWVEVVAAGRLVRLHLLTADGKRRSFDALGRDVGAQVGNALSAWLAESARAPLARPFPALSMDELVIAAKALATALPAEPPPEADKADGGEVATAEAAPQQTPAERLEQALPSLAAPLKTAAAHLVALALGADAGPTLRAIDAGNPFAFSDGDLRAALAAWPSSPSALLALAGAPAGEEAPSALERVGAAGLAWFHAADDAQVAAEVTKRFAAAGLDDQAVRVAARAVGLDVHNSWSHQSLLDHYSDTERLGAWLAQAHRSSAMHGCPMEPYLPWWPYQIRIDLAVATALMNCGRLDEAIALRANRLEGREAAWPAHTKILHKWRKDPRFVAWCYAREGFFRGEDGRVVEGFGRIEPDDGVDAGMFLDALVGVGRDHEVPLAWAHLVKGRRFATPFARLAAGRALFVAGLWREGLEELFFVEMRAPAGGHQVAIAHALRLLAAAPIEPLAAAVAAQLEAGATTLAARLARDIADFLPGAGDAAPIATALRRRPMGFDAAWLSGFTTPARARIDAQFSAIAPSLAGADALVDRWRDAIVELPVDDVAGVAEATAYVAAQALTRYLAATTDAPNVVSGGLRTVAAEAIDALALRPQDLGDRALAALFAALEPLANAVEPSLYHDWLGHLERRLAVDERSDDGTVAPDVRVGPGQLADVAARAADLVRRRPDGWALQAAQLAGVHAFATGGIGAVEWAAAVDATVADGSVSNGDALDALAAAAYLSVGDDLGPSIVAARARFRAGLGEAAFSVACDGLAGVKDAFRDPRVQELAAPWKAAKLDVPFTFEGVAGGIFDALQRGNPARAERLGRWALALDSNNAEAHRNVGLAYTQQGKLAGGMEHLMRATRDQATQLLSGVLYHAGRIPDAMTVLDYASRWYVRADQWLTYGGIAYAAMDNPRTVKAYELAYTLDPDAFDPSMLNGYAGVLDEVGDYDTCERIARHLLRVAGDDLMWLSNGWNHLACALIGQDKSAEAIELAEKAVAKNPLPDNNDNFAKTLARAKAGEKTTPPPLVPTEPQRPAIYALIDDADLAAAATQLSDDNWLVKRAALRASRYRYGSESRVSVTPRARAAAEQILAESSGNAALQPSLCRSFALEIRAQSDFARDPVPWLGDRMTRDNFYTEFRARGGVVLGEAPQTRPVFVDREVVPGGKLPRASDYVALLRDLAAMKPADALAKHNLDATGYVDVARAWSTALDNDREVIATIEAGLSS